MSLSFPNKTKKYCTYDDWLWLIYYCQKRLLEENFLNGKLLNFCISSINFGVWLNFMRIHFQWKKKVWFDYNFLIYPHSAFISWGQKWCQNHLEWQTLLKLFFVKLHWFYSFPLLCPYLIVVDLKASIRVLGFRLWKLVLGCDTCTVY